MKIKIDRAHRVGPVQTGERKRIRDVLVKLHSFQTKEAILGAARKKDEVSFQGYKCVLFQDLAPATLGRRHSMRPITSKLRDDNIKYRWTYPFGLTFEYRNKFHHVTELNERLRVLGLPVPMEGDASGPSTREPRSRKETRSWQMVTKNGSTLK